MSTHHTLIALAVTAALCAPMAAAAQDSSFNYIEGGIVAGFVNDVETSGTVSGGGPFELETDAGGGGFLGGAFEVSEKIHVFGEYALIGQELEVSDGVTTVDGEFDVVRWRLGVGYAHPVSDRTTVYGRLRYDNLEFKDVQVAGFDLGTDADGNGVGGEFGVIWAATPTIDLQGHVRYTAVGEVADGGSDAFDSDILVGVNARWNFRPNLALVSGYELGKITTWNLGLRYSF